MGVKKFETPVPTPVAKTPVSRHLHSWVLSQEQMGARYWGKHKRAEPRKTTAGPMSGKLRNASPFVLAEAQDLFYKIKIAQC